MRRIFLGGRPGRVASLARRPSLVLLAITVLAAGCGGSGSGKLKVFAAS